MRAIGPVSALILCLFGFATAMAQAPQTTRFRGTVAAVDGHMVTINTRQGDKVTVTFTAETPLVAPKPLEISDIKPGSFIGTAAVPGAAGELQSLEVVVFPESMRGTGEGHYDWDLTPNSSMTNANVEAVVQETAGRELLLSYKGGSLKVKVPANAPIVTPVKAEFSEIKAGVPVFVAATKEADGHFAAVRAWVGRNGVAPPM